ncbi:hypothetical protein FOA52_007991 [Chlamydomonas sp. UWO 241]|nr:hypothetical protein FOA52_007991 [Chlamydomonas sp. UWO 241]
MVATVATIDDALAESLQYAKWTDKSKAHLVQPTTDRSSFIPVILSPGPAAYEVNMEPVVELAPSPVFGSSTRSKEERRYMSAYHSTFTSPADLPGPGTYRVAKGEAYERNPYHTHVAAASFGSAPQRTDESRFGIGNASPGPMYNATAETRAPKWTVGERREGTSKVFISEMHSRVERRGDYAAAPNSYPLEDAGDLLTSARKAAPHVTMPRSLRVQPRSFGTITPGAVYESASTLSPHGTGIGRGPRTPASETCVPGPGTYDVRRATERTLGSLGDSAPLIREGGAIPAGGAGTRHGTVPGPGAYNQRDDGSNLSYSVASCIRTDFAAIQPGVGAPAPNAYDTSDVAHRDSKNTRSPAFSLGRLVVTSETSRSPGPIYLPTTGAIPWFTVPSGARSGATSPTSPLVASGAQAGYSFGGRERTKGEKSTVSVRYHGPLAAREGLGTEGPGPAYNVADASMQMSRARSPQKLRIGTASRDARVFISKLHAEAESGHGSPGPCAYVSVDEAAVTSRYDTVGGAKFGRGDRFTSKASTL